MTGRRQPLRGSRIGAIILLVSVLVGLPSPALANTEVTGVDIQLPRGSRLSGTITGPGGAPVVGAFVSACDLDTCPSGDATGADGAYQIRGLVPGEYLVRVDPPEGGSDLLPVFYTAGGPVETQDEAELVDATADVTGIDLAMTSSPITVGHRLSGIVTVSGVGTRAGIEVRANGPTSAGAVTAADGSYTIRGLRDGDYTMDVFVPETLDGLSGPVVGSAVGDPEDDGTITTIDGADVTGRNISTARGRRMSGRLTGPDAAGGRIYAASPAMERSALLEPDGDWTVRGLRPGAYVLTFQAPMLDESWESLMPLGYWDGGGALAADPDAAVPVTVAGTDVTGRDASVAPGATLFGTVRDVRGMGLQDAFVLVCADSVGCVSRLSDEDGAWTFARLRPATYRIQVWHQDHIGGWYGVGGFADDAAHAASVAIGAVNVGPIPIVLPDGHAISGTVTGPTGPALAGVDVLADGGMGIPPVPPGHDQTAADGSYLLLGLKAGRYKVHFSAPEGGDALSGYADLDADDGYTAESDDATEIDLEDDPGLAYVPIAPSRVLDSRTAVGVTGAFASSTPRSFLVAGVGAIPDDAIAVTGNLTVTGQTSAGYVAVGPTMTSQPTSSTLNIPLGDTRANNLTLPLSASGRLAGVFKGSAGSRAHLVLDITGYFVDADAATYTTMPPARVLDTRPGGTGLSGTFRSGTPRTLKVTGTHGIPSGAVAITANLTVVGQTSGGYLSVTPSPQANPATSTLNAPRGDVRANGLTARLSGSGTLSIVWKGAGGSTAHVLLDVTGYYLDGPAGLSFHPVSPGRVLDTRQPAWATMLTGRFTSGTPRALQVGGHAMLPAAVDAVTGNLTVVGQTAGGYVSLTPTPTASPSTSTINVPTGDTRANGVTAPVSGGDDVSLVYKSSSGARTHLILDLTGYFD